MKFQAGQWWKTRYGNIEYVIGVIPESVFMGQTERVITIGRNQFISRYRADGKMNSLSHNHDLVELMPAECKSFDYEPDRRICKSLPPRYVVVDSAKTEMEALLDGASVPKLGSVWPEGEGFVVESLNATRIPTTWADWFCGKTNYRWLVQINFRKKYLTSEQRAEPK